MLLEFRTGFAARVFDGSNLPALVQQLVRELGVLLLDLCQALLRFLQLLDGRAAVLLRLLELRVETFKLHRSVIPISLESLKVHLERLDFVALDL